ncbi:MAG: hypothetical protein AAF436_02510 [Myxococcota bacterium]
MAEEVQRNEKVKWMTTRIEFSSTDQEMERFFFMTRNDNKYYVDLRPANRSSELVAVSLVRDAFLNDKNLNIWFEERGGRRWVKALNLWG